MSSSSAYNNVLLKIPVQPQPAAVPKRDYQNDTAASDFQQTLQDVRDSSLRQKDVRDKDVAQNLRAQNLRETNRRQDEKLAQSASDKAAASADNRKPTNDASRQKDSVDNADQSEQNRAGDNVCAKDKTISSKSTDNKKIKKTEDTTEDATTTSTTTSVAPSDTELPSTLAIAAATANTDENSLTTKTPTDLVATNADSASAKNKNAEGADLLLTQAGESNSDTTQVSTDSRLQQTITQQNAADAASQQAALASVTQSATASPIVATTSTAESVPADSVADVLASLSIDSLGTEKSSGKTKAADASTGVDAEAEATSTPKQDADAKSSFEKMLQSVARAGVTTKDEGAPANAANNPNNSSSTSSNATESLFRMSDAQTPAARNFVVQTAVQVPVGQPQWSEAVGERVLWLAAQNVTSAEINLHPKDLGPIQVKVSVNQEQATVSFTSHHAVVREVLDQNLNRLRDMFNEQGLNLVNVDVSDKSFSRQQDESKDQKGQGDANSVAEDETPVAISAIVQQRLVDHYA